jgi:hypothetical protein
MKKNRDQKPYRFIFSFAALVISCVGCTKLPSESEERTLAFVLATASLEKPSAYVIYNASPTTTPHVIDGWCPKEKLNITFRVSGKRVYIFNVTCPPQPEFEFRVDYKVSKPLLYIDPKTIELVQPIKPKL